MADEHTTNQTILVVGGGMSGITAALEASEAGYDVVLLEKNAYLGGRVTQLHQYFPKLCPPNCGLEINFKRMRVNPRIRFFTMAEVLKISGRPGDYDIEVKLSPRYVNEKCTCCGKCGEVCETEISNAFNYGMGKVKAAYLPHEFAFPMRYVLDPSIVGEDQGKKCLEACQYGAIELDMKETTFDLKVGSIVWAAGWEPYDASKIEYYGFGQYKNIITNVMMERLAAHDGPTGGKILRPSDGKEPKKIAFIQCAGSRDENHLAYCSGICCLASLKQTTYIREILPECDVTIFFIDIRALDRLEDFYTKVQQDKKVSFVKSKIALMTEDETSKDLLLEGENTRTGEQIRDKFDLVVLATGMVPNRIGIENPPDVIYDDYGFMTFDPAKPGIYGAGCVRRPTDVASSVQDATSAALKAIQTISRR
ncbi:MAG: heterodisulfide reductase subunit A [Deltaproteobacteria bacterium CG23_combo_of_CG06-09_8_20_14_all_51_20]|nr:CoB--CoM heterodisulfide reductase iron-sulfur subunit A family protein [Deltaproteobacteria bacterium]PIP45670.1 MAG: heterodisulfide reductase subunit A [Deltaproteobacteria bacterium CG23_combo_of_CG06-09_8_20_14_all_51_20]PIV99272.1 MAG: heterodisulfide reductase subunit A [Deltaproteobacteria bacterium CG17_big_fil_post_rev_8_21_14_2_50_51_6]PIY26944.1 MAG: heterodisulfide reductase subunit A [Deltaproteobacteria bacterium CG_4_10_14_3_um_filter_51_14]PJB37179.1 MAG: heterodisulfide red